MPVCTIRFLTSSFFGDRETQQNLFNAMGSMYVAILFIGITNATAVQPVVSVERFVSYRERAAGIYSALPFAFAQVSFWYFFHYFYSLQSMNSLHLANVSLCAGCHRVPLCVCTDNYLLHNFLLPGFIWVDCLQIYLVHILYVFHHAVLHLVWDDDNCCNTKS